MKLEATIATVVTSTRELATRIPSFMLKSKFKPEQTKYTVENPHPGEQLPLGVLGSSGRGGHFPLHFGCRFCMKALIPSFASSVFISSSM